MRIAIIGFGSLIWDMDNLAPHVDGDWFRGNGPQMPVEFSRISPKRAHALVLVVDETLDHQCETSVIASNRSSLELAIEDLARRERCHPEQIGVAVRGETGGRTDEWLKSSFFDACIWTALPANFAEETGKPYTHENGLSYLQSLEQASLAEGWRYIEYAPRETDTPFRRFLAGQKFWASLDFSGGA